MSAHPTQKKAKHTPAPWVRDGTLMSDHLEIDLRLDRKGENWITVKGDRENVVEANAALVTAAPEMYAALARIAMHTPQDMAVGARNVIAAARAIVAKAEGRAVPDRRGG